MSGDAGVEQLCAVIVEERVVVLAIVMAHSPMVFQARLSRTSRD